MKKLRFEKIILLSKKNKSSNLFEFNAKKNLITANANSCGKSTLLKALLWGLGCEPFFKDDWKEQECLSLVNFRIDNTLHQVLRDGNAIYYMSDQEHKIFSKITGGYAKFFSSLVGFSALLPARKSPEQDATIFENPPPSYYFLPFYIDQARGWDVPLEDFDKLKQYAKWKKTIVQSHTGYISDEYFKLSQDIADSEELASQAHKQVEKITTALTVINDYVPSHNLSIEPEEFEEIEQEITEELNELLKEQEQLINKLSALQNDNHFIDAQLRIAKNAVYELEQDYLYATEFIEDEFECPLCATVHDNSIINRASILDDKERAQIRETELNESLDTNTKNIDDIKNELGFLKTRIEIINKKYSFTDKFEREYGLVDFIDGFASRSVKANVKSAETEKRSFIQEKQEEQKQIKKDQKKLLPKERQKELDDFFQQCFIDIKRKLKVDNLNTDKVKKPTDYSKLAQISGGSADSIRVFLAYNIALFKLINFANQETIAPMMVDTFNQQEQDDNNYQAIITYLNSNMPDESQIIICAMPNKLLSDYEKEAKVIHLDENKLLQSKSFKEHEKEVSEFLKNFD